MAGLAARNAYTGNGGRTISHKTRRHSSLTYSDRLTGHSNLLTLFKLVIITGANLRSKADVWERVQKVQKVLCDERLCNTMNQNAGRREAECETHWAAQARKEAGLLI